MAKAHRYRRTIRRWDLQRLEDEAHTLKVAGWAVVRGIRLRLLGYYSIVMELR